MNKSNIINQKQSINGLVIPQEYDLVSLDDLKDDILGKIGSADRNLYEAELSEELLGEVIKHVRKIKNLSQQELGNLVGVGKSQISRIEKNYNNVTIANFLKILHALNVKVKLSVELPDESKQEIALA